MTKQGNIDRGIGLLAEAVKKDQSLDSKRDDFLRSMEQEWLSTSGPSTFRKIMLDRLLKMNPSHKKGLELKHEMEQRDSNQTRLYLMLEAKRLIPNNDPEGVIEILSGTLGARPHGKVGWLPELAYLLTEAGRHKEALQRLREAKELDGKKTVQIIRCLWQPIYGRIY